jgi:hypothetical protein
LELLRGDTAGRQCWLLAAAALVCAAFLCPVPVAVLRACYQQNGGWPNTPALIYFWTSVSPTASLALFGLMVRQLRTYLVLKYEALDEEFSLAAALIEARTRAGLTQQQVAASVMRRPRARACGSPSSRQTRGRSGLVAHLV